MGHKLSLCLCIFVLSISNALACISSVDQRKQGFIALDTNHDGIVDFKEYENHVDEMIKGTEEGAKHFFNQLDSDKNKEISWHEYQLEFDRGNEKEARDQFDHIHKSKTDVISLEEFKKDYVKNNGYSMSAEELFTTIDSNKDDKITLDEYQASNPFLGRRIILPACG